MYKFCLWSLLQLSEHMTMACNIAQSQDSETPTSVLKRSQARSLKKLAASWGQGNVFLRKVMLSTNYMAVQPKSWHSSWSPARENQTEQLSKTVNIYYYSLPCSQAVLMSLQSSFTRKNTANSEQVKWQSVCECCMKFHFYTFITICYAQTWK